MKKQQPDALQSIDLGALQNVTGGRTAGSSGTSSSTAVTTALTAIEQTLSQLTTQSASSGGSSSQMMQMMMMMMERSMGISMPSPTGTAASGLPTALASLPKTYY